MTAREVLDGIKAREPHIQCEDCGKCRVVEGEEWCYDCVYSSCERGPDCADAAPTDVARLTGALREAAEARIDGLYGEPLHIWLYARAATIEAIN